MEKKVTVNYLDHVAISVTDVEKSAEWYENVIGLRRHIVPEWGGVSSNDAVRENWISNFSY